MEKEDPNLKPKKRIKVIISVLGIRQNRLNLFSVNFMSDRCILDQKREKIEEKIKTFTT